jgi:Na+/H+ antiporter NhaD/arsenite permease-like protein
MNAAAILASLIFIVCLILIFTEVINSTIVAFVGATLMLVLGHVSGFYLMDNAIEAIDFETLGLLMSMMILVSMLEPTGFFEYLAVHVARASRGNSIRLFILLGCVTAVLSMFLPNVTTIVLIAPVTILISDILGISALPFLMAEALLSNVGGAATLVGDPPNVLISHAVGFSFNDFLIHSLPIVLVACVGALILLMYLFRDELSKETENARAVMELEPADALNHPVTARRILVVLCATVLMFLVHHLLNIGPAFVTLCAVSVALIWVRPDLKDVLKRVEWSVLIFFGALFVMVGGLESAGVLTAILGLVNGLTNVQPVIFGLSILWIAAILSAVVDNIPITIALIPIIQGLANTGMDVAPLWWALVFGVGFGGNGTIIGSSSGILIASISEKTHTPITAELWSRRGLPTMLLTCVISSLLYIILYSTY